MRKFSVSSFMLKLSVGLCVISAFGITAIAQKNEHYNSPLYSPRKYDPSKSSSNGIPKPLRKVGIDQKLNSQIPLDAEFTDSSGKKVRLGKYFGNEKPIVLALVYFECPMLCNEVLNGMTGSLKGLSFNVGKEFDVVAISFDARENGECCRRNSATRR